MSSIRPDAAITPPMTETATDSCQVEQFTFMARMPGADREHPGSCPDPCHAADPQPNISVAPIADPRPVAETASHTRPLIEPLPGLHAGLHGCHSTHKPAETPTAKGPTRLDRPGAADDRRGAIEMPLPPRRPVMLPIPERPRPAPTGNGAVGGTHDPGHAHYHRAPPTENASWMLGQPQRPTPPERPSDPNHISDLSERSESGRSAAHDRPSLFSYDNPVAPSQIALGRILAALRGFLCDEYGGTGARWLADASNMTVRQDSLVFLRAQLHQLAVQRAELARERGADLVLRTAFNTMLGVAALLDLVPIAGRLASTGALEWMHPASEFNVTTLVAPADMAATIDDSTSFRGAHAGIDRAIQRGRLGSPDGASALLATMLVYAINRFLALPGRRLGLTGADTGAAGARRCLQTAFAHLAALSILNASGEPTDHVCKPALAAFWESLVRCLGRCADMPTSPEQWVSRSHPGHVPIRAGRPLGVPDFTPAGRPGAACILYRLLVAITRVEPSEMLPENGEILTNAIAGLSFTVLFGAIETYPGNPIDRLPTDAGSRRAAKPTPGVGAGFQNGERRPR